MKKQEVSPSGLSKASSPRSPVWSQVSVCVYCTWLHALALQFVVRFFLKYGLVSLDATIILCLCVLMSLIWISKANMTFWAHLNCCYYSWRHMMSLPIRPQPLRKLPVVWHCHSGKMCFSSSLFCLRPSVCMHCTPSCALMLDGVGGLKVAFRVTPSCGTPTSRMASQSLSAASAKHIDPAKHCAVQEQKERKDCKTFYHCVIFSSLLSRDSFDPQLWTRTSRKGFVNAHLCRCILAFVQIIDIDRWRQI